MLADGTTLKMDAKCKVALLEKVESMASRALRCLAVAQKVRPRSAAERCG